MIKKILVLTSLVVLLSTTIFSQSKSITTTVYFDNDKYEMRDDGKKTIEKILDSLSDITISKIVLNGHTDSNADSLYNIALSDNRNNTVKNYLVSKGINQSLINSTYFGEDKPISSNQTDQGKQKNRRVDITIYYTQHQEPILNNVVEDIDTCLGRDTIIILSGGTQLVFNRCEYLQLKDCIEITEIANTEDALANNVTTMDDRGRALASCGMIGLNINPDCSNQGCFNTPVKVRFPVQDKDPCQPCQRGANLYMSNAEGQWNLLEGNKSMFNIVEENGTTFFEFEIRCPRNQKWNCDCRILENKVKIKTKRGYTISNVQLINDCPFTVIPLRPKKRPHVAKSFHVPCYNGPTNVVATVINEVGDTLVLDEMPLAELKKRKRKPRCVTPNYVLYRKYFIKKKQLKKKID